MEACSNSNMVTMKTEEDINKEIETLEEEIKKTVESHKNVASQFQQICVENQRKVTFLEGRIFQLRSELPQPEPQQEEKPAE